METSVLVYSQLMEKNDFKNSSNKKLESNIDRLNAKLVYKMKLASMAQSISNTTVGVEIAKGRSMKN